MAASPDITAFVDQLIALFNERSMDLPDGCFTRHTQFLLNGEAFEEMLGRSANDPLVLMLARGPAGYRFTAKAVQHAVPDAVLQRGELHESTENGAQVVRAECWLSGRTRGDNAPVEMIAAIEMRVSGRAIERVNVELDPALVSRLRAARLL
jgi:hypothetical protein